MTIPQPHAGFVKAAVRRAAPFAVNDTLTLTYMRADSVMLGHLVVPTLDPSRRPMSLSRAGPRLLRRWGFKGLIVTDALDMGAIAKHWGENEAALSALRAGVDILLVPKDPGRLIAHLRAEALLDADLLRSLSASMRRLEAVGVDAYVVRPPRDVASMPRESGANSNRGTLRRANAR